MAIYHASVKTFSRSRGHSAVAAAAYRARCRIVDQRTGVAHDYTRHAGIVRVDIFAPTGAPAWATDPDQLWNGAEASETRVNARVARELELGLPAELDAEQRSALTSDIARLLVDRYQAAVMAAIHAPDSGGDQRNHHAHLLFSVRRLGPNGFGEKVRELDDRQTGPAEVESLRAAVAALTNAHLERAGHHERVDHRSLRVQASEAEARGDTVAAVMLTREPMEHEGKAVTSARRRGEWMERAEANDTIAAGNRSQWVQLIEKAEAEGRLLATPARSDRTKAGADRAREEAVQQSASLPSGSTVRSSASPSRTLARGVSTDAGRNRIRLTRAKGQHADVVNQQAEVAEQTLKAEADVARAYRQELESTLRQTGLNIDHPIRAYVCVQVRRFTQPDIEALANHCRKDRRCVTLLGQCVEARGQWERAKTRALRRRNDYGQAMVRTTQGQRAWEAVEEGAQPSAWQRASRREWAERRRRQRALLEQARQVEHSAARATGDDAMRMYAKQETAARLAVHQIEGKRRERYPVPSDRRPFAPRLKPSWAAPVSDPSPPTPRPQPDAAERLRRPRP